MSDYESYECPCGRKHAAGIECAIGRRQSNSSKAEDLLSKCIARLQTHREMFGITKDSMVLPSHQQVDILIKDLNQVREWMIAK